MKKAVILFTILSAIFLSGCSLKNSLPTFSSISDSIKKAIGKSPTLLCSYQDEKNIQQTVYIKDEDLRVDGVETLIGPGSVIKKGNQLWMWNQEKAEGIYLDLDKNESAVTGFDLEEFRNRIEYQKQNCSATMSNDSLFNPPEKVNFKGYEQYQEEQKED